MQKLHRLRGLLIGAIIGIALVTGVLSVIIGIGSIFYQDEYEFKEERLCTVIDPRVGCNPHCSAGAVGEEHCIIYCNAIVRAHPDDDIGHCIDEYCLQRLTEARNRTTRLFSEHDSFYEYSANTNVTCYLNMFRSNTASYDVHSGTRTIVVFFAIGLGLVSLILISVFVFGFISTLIHRMLPHHWQFKDRHHHHHHHHEEEDNKAFL